MANLPKLEINLHPCAILGAKFTNLGLEFCHYEVDVNLDYGDEPGTRVLFSVPGRKVNELFLQEQLILLYRDKPGVELAILSRMTDATSGVYHWPMVDFALRDPRPLWHKIARRDAEYGPWLSRIMGKEFYFFCSGNHMHGYGTELLTQAAWDDFLERVPKLNELVGCKLIDESWAQLSLRRGFGILRWSCNTFWYKQYPTLVA